MRVTLYVAAALLLAWGLLAMLADVLPLEPNRIELTRILQAPSRDACLGYDDLGRNIAHRIVFGARTSFTVAVVVSLASFLIGTLVGLCAAAAGAWVDVLLVRLIDVFMAFPGTLLAIALAGVLGPGLHNVMVALVTVGWVGFARIARAQAMSVYAREHVQAAEMLGTAPAAIVRLHILPLISAPLMVEGTFVFAAAIIAEAGLSFLGLGVQAPAASWGSMIRDAVAYMLVAPHAVLGPGLAIASTVLAVNLLGDCLRDVMDVKLTPGPGLG